jgi:hypothetical protein
MSSHRPVLDRNTFGIPAAFNSARHVRSNQPNPTQPNPASPSVPVRVKMQAFRCMHLGIDGSSGQGPCGISLSVVIARRSTLRGNHAFLTGKLRERTSKSGGCRRRAEAQPGGTHCPTTTSRLPLLTHY